MPSKIIQVQIENQVLKLSNLDKILFPGSGIIKAELIDYYRKVAPYMLQHLKNRPLTLIRFPDGIDKIKFYSKNKADWTPEWITHVMLPDNNEIQYLIANDTPSLIYLANLSAIELHCMTIDTKNNLPNQIIFDLDPPEGIAFDEIKTIAFGLKDLLESYGYVPFIKTSGSKGLHVYVPIIQQYTQDKVIEIAKTLAKEIVAKHSNTTLGISKERRTNKILIDIYRNHRSQTCVAPYSVRGKENAPVSTPISWDDLSSLQSAQAYNIQNIFEYLDKEGDVWQNIYNCAKPLHSEIGQIVPEIINNSLSLEKYAEKRNFELTTEPKPEIGVNNSGVLRYVIQKHKASNLHYDLRLEHQSVLCSWAIPKAMPELPGVKRMAIQTEDHPMKYIDFEGIIPQNEYGGGEMWVFDTGELNMIKKEENKIKFALTKGKITGEFYLYRTNEKQWLIEKKEATKGLGSIPIQPMLAELSKIIPKNFSYEIKWDGIRVLIRKEGEKIEILSKSGRDITRQFPEIVNSLAEFDAQSAMLDGEIVVLNDQGIPDFPKVISRMHLTGGEAIEKASKTNISTVYLFDLLYLDGLDTRNLPLEKRRKWLNISFKDTISLRFSQSFSDGEALFTAINEKQMEGIICKRIGSIYQSNARNNNWQKVKVKNIEDAVIIGYTRGKGDRALLFGALLLGQFVNEELVYKGKVGTGFTEEKMKDILRNFANIPKTSKPIKEAVEEEMSIIWLEPKVYCEVQFASLTPNNTFREPVFVRIIEEI